MSDKNTELKSNLKDIFKTVLVLVIIACISGGLLGAINAVTYMSEDEILAQKMGKVYKADSFINLAKVTEEEYSSLNAVVTEFNKKEGANKSLALLPVKNGTVEPDTVIYRCYGAGDYDCTLLIVVKQNKITDVSVYGSSATPGIGDKAYADKYVSQFKGIDLLTAKEFDVAKKASKVDNVVEQVAGATKSSTAVKNAINTAMRLHKALFLKEVA